MKITVLLRVPYLDKIPNLKTLLIDLYKKGTEIEIISAVNPDYPAPDFKEFPNIKLTFIKERSKKLELPTLLKLCKPLFWRLLFNKPNYFIGGDEPSNRFLSRIKKIFPLKHINFVLEYPDINDQSASNAIESADYIITHDKWHSDFLKKYYNLSDKKILYLPNASYTEVNKERSHYLSNILNIPEDKQIILHSGGLGNWFCSKELARSATKWDSSYALVFHTSHSVEHNPYFIELKEEIKDAKNIWFSTTPVPNTELDKLNASAKIGLAIYSLDVLGYRAENMGLAAGKIGNYLKCGIPVIATKVHSLSYLEKYHCGILVENTDNIDKAIETILNDYDSYVEGAYKCYDELWEPQKYCDKIYEVLNTGN